MQKKLILSDNCLTAIVVETGNIYTKTEATVEDYHNALNALDELQLKIQFNPELFAKEKAFHDEVKRVENIHLGWKVLEETGDFTVTEDAVYMTGIKRSLPQLLTDAFCAVVGDWQDGGEAVSDISLSQTYNALKRFWKKCCLNPNAQSAEDLYRFLEKHNMKITANGNFLAYRRVVSKTSENKELVEFIANQYTKIKARKKGPANYFVYFNALDKAYSLVGIDAEECKDDFIGNLKELYLNLPDLQQVGYTDNHTQTFDYRIGEIASIERDKGDDNNRVSCSKGLHSASKEYDYSAFGDTDILVIINPMHVLAVPQNEDGKLRTSAFYFACTLSYNERHILDETDFDVTELDDLFEEKMMINLEEEVKKGFAEEVKRHTFSLPALSTVEIKSIVLDLQGAKQAIKDRVSNFEQQDEEYD